MHGVEYKSMRYLIWNRKTQKSCFGRPPPTFSRLSAATMNQFQSNLPQRNYGAQVSPGTI
jgi:hypothetical protein